MSYKAVGYSDIGGFTIVSPVENKIETIFCPTGTDGYLTIDIIENKNELPDDLKTILETDSWLWIYDDEQRTLKLPPVKKMSLYSNNKLRYFLLIEK